MGRQVRLATLLLLVAGSLVECQKTPTSPSPGPVGALSLTCPAAVSVTGVLGSTQAVTYASPMVTGGVPPTTVTCLPTSGSLFSVGSNNVSCTGKDSSGQTAACTFTVALTASQLSAKTFVAFGDSVTAGEDGSNDTTGSDGVPASPVCISQTNAFTSAYGTLAIHKATSYPQQLLAALSSEFPSESLSMINEGLPGEDASAADGSPSGDKRVGCVVNLDHPDALLVLEGGNDLNFAPDTATASANVPHVLTALQTDISTARARGVSFVFVDGMLPQLTPVQNGPQCPGGPDFPCRNNLTDEFIVAVNGQIASATAAAGAIYVDSYSALVAKDPTLATLIGPDGFHPTALGYQVIAQTFLARIMATVPHTARALARPGALGQRGVSSPSARAPRRIASATP